MSSEALIHIGGSERLYILNAQSSQCELCHLEHSLNIDKTQG